MQLTRRKFVSSIALGFALQSALSAIAQGTGRRPRVLLRSSWKTDNIGDIAHTPGLLAILEQHVPEAEITLLPSLPHGVADGVAEMLLRRFPRLNIIREQAGIARAFSECDFFLHGSGPSLVAHKDVALWRDTTGKPYGVAGITMVDAPEHLNATIVALLNGARFVYFRDGPSLKLAQASGVRCPIMAFGPDAAFAVDLRDEARAAAFMARNGLEPGRFLVCIPAHRRTPRWLVPRSEAGFDPAIQSLNDKYKDRDHAPHREAIVRVVREFGMKVLVCAEQVTEIALGKEVLVDPLPDDVRERVVFREDFWLTDEALSVFVRSAGLFGNEMHSPIMCIGNGIPAVIGRWNTQTTKGFMWRDIGLDEWLFDFEDERALSLLPNAVVALARDPAAARAKAAMARTKVRNIFGQMMHELRGNLP